MTVEIGNSLLEKIRKGRESLVYVDSLLNEVGEYGIEIKSKDEVIKSLKKYDEILGDIEKSPVIYANPKTQDGLLDKIPSNLSDGTRELLEIGIKAKMEEILKNKKTQEETITFLEGLEKNLDSLILTPSKPMYKSTKESEPRVEKEKVSGKRSGRPPKYEKEKLLVNLHEAVLKSGFYDEDFEPYSVMANQGLKNEYNALLRRSSGSKEEIKKEYEKRKTELARKVDFPIKNLNQCILKVVRDFNDTGDRATEDTVTKEIRKLGKIDKKIVGEKLKKLRKNKKLEGKHDGERRNNHYYVKRQSV